jgi:hypothetical protein
MNGRTIDRMTWDMTSNASIPGRPTATATTMEGIRLRSRVINRRTTGCGNRGMHEHSFLIDLMI